MTHQHAGQADPAGAIAGGGWALRLPAGALACGLTVLCMGNQAAGAALLPGAHAVVSPDAAQADRQMQARAAALRTAWRATHRGAAVTAPPAIVSGTILTPTLDVRKAPAAVALRLRYTVDTPGLAEINVQFTAPSGLQTDQLFYGLTSSIIKGSGTVTIQDPQGAVSGASSLGHYAEPGIWTLTRLSIWDNRGESAQYDGAAVKAVIANPTFTLANTDAPDSKPPILITGRIVTKTADVCSYPPLVELSVTASDDVSGISSVGVGFAGPGGDSLGAGWLHDAPVGRSGAVATKKLKGYLSPGEIPGTYTIVSFGACDAAGNCFSDSSSADVTSIFGKAIHMQVTKSFNCK